MKMVFSTASSHDIDTIHQIITHYARKGLILKRSREEILDNLDNFFTCTIENSIAGIGSYYNYGDSLKEIRSLAVLEKHQRNKVGSFIVKKLIAYLLNQNQVKPKIFTLTYSPGFFQKNGFTVVPKDTLPEKIWKDCSKCESREQCGETALVYNSSVY
ncbi:MAG TPA: GNAT family N-acetyltransferase [Spirochaetota bacterium]|nr:GNAT family N-acetyltransferase [Spirochaetota bacterium]HPI88082.1 GNAT family N-acetyltransferase [Spirochaetota bacterium]HPR46433.1 GNAT family N-acetyltransferase [Spirochaetota bacterium]